MNSYLRQLLITLIPAMVILMLIAIAKIFFHVGLPSLTRDVTAIGNIHPLSGFLSSLGILLWCVSASVCFFSAMILRKFKVSRTLFFLLSSAFLSTYLLFDDLFLIHEKLASWYLGISEKLVIGILGIAVVSYLVIFRKIIFKTRYGVFLLAIIFLFLSVAIDTHTLGKWLWHRIGMWVFFLEDGAKWLGIANWCSYYVYSSHQFLFESFTVPTETMSQAD